MASKNFNKGTKNTGKQQSNENPNTQEQEQSGTVQADKVKAPKLLIRTSVEYHEYLKKAAHAEWMNVTQYINKLIAEDAQKHPEFMQDAD